MVLRRHGWGLALVALMTLAFCGETDGAQAPRLYLSINSAQALPDSMVPISISIANPQDSVAGFGLSITLSRPDIMEFVAAPVIKTCYRCSNPACTAVVAYPCTVLALPIESGGTLTQNWPYLEAKSSGSSDLRVAGLADVNFSHAIPPIPPGTSGTLIKVFAHMLCDIPDTLQDRSVNVVWDLVGSWVSDQQGTLIQPLGCTSGTITALTARRGDLNSDGVVDVVDLIQSISIAFVAAPPACPHSLPDVNCDNQVDVMDVVYLSNYVFMNGNQPCLWP